jgi:hypothetical protein
MRGDQKPGGSESLFQLTGANLPSGFDFDVAPAAARRDGTLENSYFVSRAASEAPTRLAPAAGGDQGRYFVLAGEPTE